MKSEPGPDLVIFGSGTIVSQFAEERLIDEFQIVVSPIVLGSGSSMFEGVNQRLPLRRTKAMSFANGNVWCSGTIRWPTIRNSTPAGCVVTVFDRMSRQHS